MAIKIPVYENRVRPETQSIPKVPDVGNPNLVMSSLNKGFEANQQTTEVLGKIGSQIANYALEKQKIQNEQLNASLELGYRQDLQNLLYSQQPETVKVNGQDVTRPSGVLNRQLWQAIDSTVDFDARGSQLLNRYLDQVKDPVYKQKLALQLGSYSMSQRDNVLKNELKQSNDNTINIFQSHINQQISDAASIKDVASLNRAIDGIKISQENLNRAKFLDSDTGNINTKKSISNLVNQSVTNALMTTGDLRQAEALLGGVQGRLGVDDYNDISKKLSQGFNQLRQRIQSQAREDQTINRYNYLTDVINGKIDWSNADKAISDVGVNDPALAESIGRLVQSGGQYIPTTINDLAFMNTVKVMINLEDKQQVSDYLLKTLNNKNGVDISMDRLSVLVSAAKQRHDELNKPVQQKQNNAMKSAIDYFQKSNPMLAPTMFMNYVHDLFSNKNKSAEQIKQDAVKKAIINEYPEIGNIRTIPNKISYPNQNVNLIYDGIEQIQGIDDGDYSDQSE